MEVMIGRKLLTMILLNFGAVRYPTVIFISTKVLKLSEIVVSRVFNIQTECTCITPDMLPFFNRKSIDIFLISPRKHMLSYSFEAFLLSLLIRDFGIFHNHSVSILQFLNTDAALLLI